MVMSTLIFNWILLENSNTLIILDIKVMISSANKVLCIIMAAYVSQSVIDEMRRIVEESGIMEKSDSKWPKPDKIGKQ